MLWCLSSIYLQICQLSSVQNIIMFSLYVSHLSVETYVIPFFIEPPSVQKATTFYFITHPLSAQNYGVIASVSHHVWSESCHQFSVPNVVYIYHCWSESGIQNTGQPLHFHYKSCALAISVMYVQTVIQSRIIVYMYIQAE